MMLIAKKSSRDDKIILEWLNKTRDALKMDCSMAKKEVDMEKKKDEREEKESV